MTVEGMLWMMVIGRGVAGVSAGCEYTVCTSQAVECADSSEAIRQKRGMLVAVATNAAIISGFVGSSIVALIVIAAYGGTPSDGKPDTNSQVRRQQVRFEADSVP
jgi:MFS family permease